MSLDVYLIKKETSYVCPCCGHRKVDNVTVYDANITHNLGKMAKEAGIYMHLWRPEEIGIKEAWELIKPIEEGLYKLEDNPEYYKQFDSPNGWGLYINFVPFVSKYLAACREFPDALVEVSR